MNGAVSPNAGIRRQRRAPQTCGLMRHELDAAHCMACGTLLRIENDNN
jgi:hypothetical protein